MKMLIVGLDAAGKTTTLYKLRVGEVETTIPTIGWNVETVKYEGKVLVSMTAWDVGGRDKIRPLWRHYYKTLNFNALVFVVDSNDRERADDAREELANMLREDELSQVPLLVFANKQDLPNAMTVAEVTDKLELHALRDRNWFIQGSTATTGDGLYEGLDWLSNTLASKRGAESKSAGLTSGSQQQFGAVGAVAQMKMKQKIDELESVAHTESTADTEVLDHAS